MAKKKSRLVLDRLEDLSYLRIHGLRPVDTKIDTSVPLPDYRAFVVEQPPKYQRIFHASFTEKASRIFIPDISAKNSMIIPLPYVVYIIYCYPHREKDKDRQFYLQGLGMRRSWISSPRSRLAISPLPNTYDFSQCFDNYATLPAKGLTYHAAINSVIESYWAGRFNFDGFWYGHPFWQSLKCRPMSTTGARNAFKKLSKMTPQDMRAFKWNYVANIEDIFFDELYD